MHSIDSPVATRIPASRLGYQVLDQAIGGGVGGGSSRDCQAISEHVKAHARGATSPSCDSGAAIQTATAAWQSWPAQQPSASEQPEPSWVTLATSTAKVAASQCARHQRAARDNGRLSSITTASQRAPRRRELISDHHQFDLQGSLWDHCTQPQDRSGRVCSGRFESMTDRSADSNRLQAAPKVYRPRNSQANGLLQVRLSGE